MTYTLQQLRNEYIRDLISDIRSAEASNRAEMAAYALRCRQELACLLPARHTARIDRYGIPKVADVNDYPGDLTAEG